MAKLSKKQRKSISDLINHLSVGEMYLRGDVARTPTEDEQARGRRYIREANLALYVEHGIELASARGYNANTEWALPEA